MKSKLFNILRLAGQMFILPLVVVLFGGCASTNKSDVMAQPSVESNTTSDKIARLHIGDTVSISYSGMPAEDTDFQPVEKPIKEDGTITLPSIGRVKAAGKTPGELEDAIHDLYVPKWVTHLTVTVKTTSDRVYYVRGEVKAPGRMIYAGSITVSKAITSAGDFTDFANRSKVYLIRANGDRFKLNVSKILNGEAPDPPVYPGDQIVVERSIF
jgi:polysaccharide export outer membrane protein